MLKCHLWCLCLAVCGVVVPAANGGEEWRQLKLDSRHSGNAADRTLAVPLGLVAAIPLSDAVFTSPAIAGGKAYVLDGAGVLWAIDQFSTGRYRPENWLFEHQSTFGFPADHKPLVRAWDIRTGKEVWTHLSQTPSLVSSGPQLDVLMCVGAFASGGNLFLTTNGSGLQASMGGM